MDIIQQGIITLIKSAITGERLPLPENFSLDEAQILIQKHSLLPLAYQGALNCGFSVQTDIMRRWQLQYFQYLARSEKQRYAVEQVCAAFEDNGIDYMPLKGCNMKKLYPKPEMRVMGDADILIRVEQYDRIKPIMKQLKYEAERGAEHELVWNHPHLHLELHKCLIPKMDSDLRAYFGVGWEKAIKKEGHRYDLSVEDSYIHLFTHMTKHFRSTGIGLRQIVDLYVYQRAYPEMQKMLVEKVMAQLGLLKFYRNIGRLLTVWFEGAPADDVTELIAAYVFANGNWGSETNRIYSDTLRKSRKASGNIKVRYVFRSLFPPLSVMKIRFPRLGKYVIAYPLCWVMRLLYGIFCAPKKVRNKIKLIGMITDEKAMDRQNSLRYMGLELQVDSGSDR